MAEPHERATEPGSVPVYVPRPKWKGLHAGPTQIPAISVMYVDGKILVLGGGDPPTNTAEVIDLN